MSNHLQMGTIIIIEEIERKEAHVQSDFQERNHIDAFNHGTITGMFTPT